MTALRIVLGSGDLDTVFDMTSKLEMFIYYSARIRDKTVSFCGVPVPLFARNLIQCSAVSGVFTGDCTKPKCSCCHGEIIHLASG